MDDFTRRDFLSLTGRGAIVLTVVGAGGLLAACNPGPLIKADANGLKLPVNFTSRIVATTGSEVAGSDYVWHAAPDGGACFGLSDGGWSYVSNSEAIAGGAGYIRFAQRRQHRRGRTLLVEHDRQLRRRRDAVGHLVELRGVGREAGCGSAARSARGRRSPGRSMGAFTHEAAAVDSVNRCVYLTEDRPDGGPLPVHPTDLGGPFRARAPAGAHRGSGRLGMGHGG